MIGCATSCAPSSLSIILSRGNNGPSLCVIDCGRILFLQRFVQIVCILLCNAYKTEVRNKHGDGDGNENGKKAIGLDKRKNNKFARASRFLVHFSAVKCLPPLAWSKDHKIWFFKVNGQFICSTPLGQISRLPRTRTKDNNFLLWCSPLEFNSKRICQHLTN